MGHHILFTGRGNATPIPYSNLWPHLGIRVLVRALVVFKRYNATSSGPLARKPVCHFPHGSEGFEYRIQGLESKTNNSNILKLYYGKCGV